DGIAVVVHPGLHVEGLTVEQLRDIYSGRLRNWKQVGGPDLKIVPFSRPTSVGGTVSFFVEDILGDRPLSTHVRLVPTSTQALQALRAEPGGIYYASAPVVIPQCGVKALPVGREPDSWVHPVQHPPVAPEQCPDRRNRLNLDVLRSGEYPLTRNLYVVVSDRSLEDERAGKTFAEFVLSERGQQLVTEAGFVAIR
ncbi:MAG: substrate-binding domain-containing protein, partial [Cyanobacteria bacterium J06648_11]